MQGLTTAYGREDERSFVRKRLLALVIVVSLVLGAMLVVGLLVLGPHAQRWIGGALDAESATAWIWWTAQWPLLIGGLLFAFAVALYIGPDTDQPRWRLLSPGAVTAASSGWWRRAASRSTRPTSARTTRRGERWPPW
jgi:membrane protein